jgi:hypothetical protein
MNYDHSKATHIETVHRLAYEHYRFKVLYWKISAIFTEISNLPESSFTDSKSTIVKVLIYISIKFVIEFLLERVEKAQERIASLGKMEKTELFYLSSEEF